MNDGESKTSWNMGDAPSMCYDCDMGYSLSGIGGSGDYVALQYEMDSSSMCVTRSMATIMHRLVNLKELHSVIDNSTR